MFILSYTYVGIFRYAVAGGLSPFSFFFDRVRYRTGTVVYECVQYIYLNDLGTYRDNIYFVRTNLIILLSD